MYALSFVREEVVLFVGQGIRSHDFYFAVRVQEDIFGVNISYDPLRSFFVDRGSMSRQDEE